MARCALIYLFGFTYHLVYGQTVPPRPPEAPPPMEWGFRITCSVPPCDKNDPRLRTLYLTGKPTPWDQKGCEVARQIAVEHAEELGLEIGPCRWGTYEKHVPDYSRGPRG
jgi:hypothetical protein